MFNPNTGKYGPEVTPYLDTFHAVRIPFLMKLKAVGSLALGYMLSCIFKETFQNKFPYKTPVKGCFWICPASLQKRGVYRNTTVESYGKLIKTKRFKPELTQNFLDQKIFEQVLLGQMAEAVTCRCSSE